jgi:hypothetical protein
MEGDEVIDKEGAKRHYLLRESDQAAPSRMRIWQTDRQSGFFSLRKLADKATYTSREKATKQRRLLLSSEDGKPTDRATDNVFHLSREEGDEATE